MSYNAKFTQMQNAVADLTTAERMMKEYAQRLETVRTQLRRTPELHSTFSDIDSRTSSVNNVASAIKLGSQCLASVCDIYLNAELNVSRKIGIKEWLNKLLRGRSKPDNNSSKISKSDTSSLEKSVDLILRTKSLDLLSEYESKWRGAKTSKEKKRLLNSYLADLQEIKSTSARSKIIFLPLNSNTKGGYNRITGTITINNKILDRPDSIVLLRTLVHEVRHAYQAEAAYKNKHPAVSEETRNVWKNNFKNYNQPTKFWKDNYDAYRNQPVEVDARWFANQW